MASAVAVSSGAVSKAAWDEGGGDGGASSGLNSVWLLVVLARVGKPKGHEVAAVAALSQRIETRSER